MLEPSSSTSPLCQCFATLSFIRLTERRNVVLPDPVGPISAVTLPLGMQRLMPDSTVEEPNPSARSLASTQVALSAATGAWPGKAVAALLVARTGNGVMSGRQLHVGPFGSR